MKRCKEASPDDDRSVAKRGKTEDPKDEHYFDRLPAELVRHLLLSLELPATAVLAFKRSCHRFKRDVELHFDHRWQRDAHLFWNVKRGHLHEVARFLNQPCIGARSIASDGINRQLFAHRHDAVHRLLLLHSAVRHSLRDIADAFRCDAPG